MSMAADMICASSRERSAFAYSRSTRRTWLASAASELPPAIWFSQISGRVISIPSRTFNLGECSNID
jgi:hypothetical protein